MVKSLWPDPHLHRHSKAIHPVASSDGLPSQGAGSSRSAAAVAPTEAQTELDLPPFVKQVASFLDNIPKKALAQAAFRSVYELHLGVEPEVHIIGPFARAIPHPFYVHIVLTPRPHS